MGRTRRLSSVSLAGLAAAGVVLGHWLTYVFALPDPVVRTEVLQASGHAYWLLAVKTATVLAVASVVTTFARYLGDPCREESNAIDRFVAVAARLAFVQVLAFTAMEAVERLVAGAPIVQMFGHHLFAVGVAVQVLVAVAGAFVLSWFGRAAQRLWDSIARPIRPQDAVVVLAPRPCSIAPLAVLAGAGGVRGPPSER